MGVVGHFRMVSILLVVDIAEVGRGIRLIVGEDLLLRLSSVIFGATVETIALSLFADDEVTLLCWLVLFLDRTR